jgi:hypothetical protein
MKTLGGKMNLHNLIDTTGNDNQEQSVSNKLPWWQNKWVVIASLFFVYPLGLFLTWKTPAFSRKSKVLLAIAFGFFFLIVQTSKDDKSPNGPANNSTINSKAEEVAKELMGLATQCCGFCYYGAKRGLELSTLSGGLLSGSVKLSSEIDNAKKQKLCMSSCKLGFDSYYNGLSEKEMINVLVGTFREAARSSESK